VKREERDLMKELAAALPDVPRWVEVRSLLLAGHGELFGPDGEGFALCDPDDELVIVVRKPDHTLIRQALARTGGMGSVLATPEDADHAARVLPDHRRVRAVIHQLGAGTERLLEPVDGVRLLEPAELEGLRDLPPELASWLRLAADRRYLTAAAFAGDRPVSFCCVAALTETLWDVAIDTLPEYRRRGHAVRCSSYMIRHMLERDRWPVWGAEEDNRASLALAARLGFVPEDELVVFRSGGRYPPAGETSPAKI
jgi:GNAT superfamily N-acetyltransferase